MILALLLDLTLAVAVIIIAYRALNAPALFTAVVLYIAFGLLLALVWVRLEAPDLALAEAAIGAGITGAMLLDATRQMGDGTAPPKDAVARFLGASAAAIFGLALITAFLSLEGSAERSLAPMVSTNLPLSGVTHPVTAILLNFRGYDTWLELGVLLAGSIGVLVLRRTRVFPATASTRPSAIAEGTTRIIVPFGILVGGYLLWRGTHAPGGAFQTGAVLGALGVLLMLAGHRPFTRLGPLELRLLLACGFLTFLLIGSTGYLTTGIFLDYPPDRAGVAILLIEAAASISIATILVLLFAGGRGSSVKRDTAP